MSHAIATSANGISTQLYDPWLWSESKETLNFLNTLENFHQQTMVDLEKLQRSRDAELEETVPVISLPNENFYFEKKGELLQDASDKVNVKSSGDDRYKGEEAQKVLENELALNIPLAVLNLSFKKKFNYLGFDLQSTFLDQGRTCNFDSQAVSAWAYNILQSLFAWSAHEKGKLCKIINKQQDSELVAGLCNWLDLSPGHVSLLLGESSFGPLVNTKTTTKRLALVELSGPSKKVRGEVQEESNGIKDISSLFSERLSIEEEEHRDFTIGNL